MNEIYEATPKAIIRQKPVFETELDRIAQSWWEMEYFSDNWCPKNTCLSWYPDSIRYFKQRLRKIIIEGTRNERTKAINLLSLYLKLKT